MASDPGSSPAVSAVVIFLDAQRFIAEAIESVLAQTFTSWELILVDDGSSDGSREVAEEYCRRHPGRIRVLQHDSGYNRGMSASRNLGLLNARGAYVGFLDADDRWPPGKLMAQVPTLERDSRLGAAIGSIAFFGELTGSQPRLRSPSLPVGVPLEPALLLYETLLAQPPLLTTLGNPLIRRTALVEVGGLEDEFTGLAEDAVGWCKLALRFRFTALPETVLEYRRHGAASGVRDDRSGGLARGNARFARWLYDYVWRQPSEIRTWALPIVTEHLFRSILLEAWLTCPDDPLRRRTRLARAWCEFSRTYAETMTVRRRLRLAAHLAGGLRTGALRGLQEPGMRRRLA